MRVDFYQLSDGPVEAALPLIARATLKAGARLLVVSEDEAQLGRIGAALWEHQGESFLAHGRAGGEHDARQPILLSGAVEAANGAGYVAFADGQWRDAAQGFERAFLLFGDSTIDSARDTWRSLNRAKTAELHYWRRENGRWREGP